MSPRETQNTKNKKQNISYQPKTNLYDVMMMFDGTLLFSRVDLIEIMESNKMSEVTTN